MSGRVIAIEGLIGAGKSTLVKNVASENKDVYALYEPVEENPYLARYYEDPSRWAFAMQMWLLSERTKMHRKADEMALEGWTVLLDRSLIGDQVFALVNYQDGNMSELEYNTYREHYDLVTSTCIESLDKIVFLNVYVETAQGRIRQRGRDIEEGIPASYLESLYKGYLNIISREIPVAWLDDVDVKMVKWDNPADYPVGSYEWVTG